MNKLKVYGQRSPKAGKFPLETDYSSKGGRRRRVNESSRCDSHFRLDYLSEGVLRGYINGNSCSGEPEMAGAYRNPGGGPGG